MFKKRCSYAFTDYNTFYSEYTNIRVRIIYKAGPDLFIADCLSRQNHKEKEDAKIPGMQLNINAMQATTNIPDCMTIHELQHVTSQDEHLQQLKEHIIQGWPENRDQIPQDLRMYWTLQDDMAVIDQVILKGRHTVILESLQRQVLEQLHVNHMGIEKTKLLVCQSIYWTGMNNDTENHIKMLFMC